MILVILIGGSEGKMRSFLVPFRNRYWSFSIEQKVFVLHLLKDRGGVLVSERSMYRSFEVDLDVSAAVWCLEVLQDVIKSDELKLFFRKHKGSQSVVLA